MVVGVGAGAGDGAGLGVDAAADWPAAAGAALGVAAAVAPGGVAGAAAGAAALGDDEVSVDPPPPAAAAVFEVPEFAPADPVDPGVDDVGRVVDCAPVCSAFSCCSVEAIDVWSCPMPTFSRAISAATAAACADFPVFVGGAVLTE